MIPMTAPVKYGYAQLLIGGIPYHLWELLTASLGESHVSTFSTYSIETGGWQIFIRPQDAEVATKLLA